MAHPFYPTGNPRFNHVAMSLPADLLGEENRTDVCRFFHEVLGFEEMEVMTEDRRRLILSCVHWDQFIFLIAEDDPMRCPRMDHYGFAVGSLDELKGIQDRAEAFRKTDDRMELIDLHMDDQQVVKIHSLYVRYLLPDDDASSSTGSSPNRRIESSPRSQTGGIAPETKFPLPDNPPGVRPTLRVRWDQSRSKEDVDGRKRNEG